MCELNTAPKRHQRPSNGFTLVEMAITLFVITIISALLLIPLAGREDIRARHEAKATLAEIREALIGFAIIHRRLPCPTLQNDPSAANYGLEDASCNQSIEGRLPWRTLGLPPTDPWGTPRISATDPWDGHWRYRVDLAFAHTANPPIAIDTVPGQDIGVRDAVSGIEMVANKMLVAVVYSTGPNRDADGDNASFEVGDATYGVGGPTTTFDDLLEWVSRPLLLARMGAAGALP